ncbi:MAG: hypothetical protein JWM16_6310 [Verrucomicrobiales bacterium]|nr:hypothetical protein [Verrucomicrobiales bacterium]
MKTYYSSEEQKANRKIWATALRSGKYQQGSSRLKTDDGAFCCLGVACDVSDIVTWKGTQPVIDGHYHSDAYLSPPMRDWLGLRTDSGEYYYGGGRRVLAWMNDHDGATFEQIADIIESEPEGLLECTKPMVA